MALGSVVGWMCAVVATAAIAFFILLLLKRLDNNRNKKNEVPKQVPREPVSPLTRLAPLLMTTGPTPLPGLPHPHSSFLLTLRVYEWTSMERCLISHTMTTTLCCRSNVEGAGQRVHLSVLE